MTDQIMRIQGHRVYGGMRLRDHPCAVFVDNPLFSELIFPNAANLDGQKTWGRWVRQTGQLNQCFVPAQAGTIEDWHRLDRACARAAGDPTWHVEQIWGGWHPVTTADHLPWLVCCPRTQILEYWYGITLDTWLARVISGLRDLGHAWEIRKKSDRKFRMRGQVPRVIHLAPQYRGVISAHSVSVIDSILAGRPAVIWGQDPSLGLATPWNEFLIQGQVRVPDLAQVQQAAWTWAATTYLTLEPEKALQCVMK